MAVIWAGGSVLVQYIYDNLGFESPFFLTFLCTAMFSLYMPVFAALVTTGMCMCVGGMYPCGVYVIAWHLISVNVRIFV